MEIDCNYVNFGEKTKCLFIVKHMGWHGDCCGAGCSELQNSLHHNGRTSILTSSGFTMMFNSLFFKLALLWPISISLAVYNCEETKI